MKRFILYVLIFFNLFYFSFAENYNYADLDELYICASLMKDRDSLNEYTEAYKSLHHRICQENKVEKIIQFLNLKAKLKDFSCPITKNICEEIPENTLLLLPEKDLYIVFTFCETIESQQRILSLVDKIERIINKNQNLKRMLFFKDSQENTYDTTPLNLHSKYKLASIYKLIEKNQFQEIFSNKLYQNIPETEKKHFFDLYYGFIKKTNNTKQAFQYKDCFKYFTYIQKKYIYDDLKNQIKNKIENEPLSKTIYYLGVDNIKEYLDFYKTPQYQEVKSFYETNLNTHLKSFFKSNDFNKENIYTFKEILNLSKALELQNIINILKTNYREYLKKHHDRDFSEVSLKDKDFDDIYFEILLEDSTKNLFMK
ncbi:MAG: hypothetical protein E7035_03190 [Verrucomicrobiaceae bacterium]|nr:hypothetical protein [Verrucomicrobiaceae bacterium]